MKTSVSWSRRNLLRWAVELRRHPIMGVAVFAIGMFFAVGTSFLDRHTPRRPSALSPILNIENNNPVVFGLAGIGIFIWILGTARFPRQHWAIFLFCFFAGTFGGRLMFAVATQLATSSLW